MGTFAFTYTSRDSSRSTSFVGHETVRSEKSPEQAREALLTASVPGPALNAWDRQMAEQGRAVVHFVVDGHPTMPVEYGIRYSYE